MNRVAKIAPANAEPRATSELVTIRGFAPAADCRTLRIRLYALLLLVDALAMAFAFFSAGLFRFGSIAGYGLTTFSLLFPIYVAIGFNGGAAWSMAALHSPRASAVAATRALVISIGVATILLFSLKVGEDFSRLVFGIGSCLALTVIALARLAIGRRIGERYDWTFRRDVLLLDGAEAGSAHNELVIDARSSGLRPDCDDPAMLDRIGRLLDGAERVAIACAPERREAWTRALSGANVAVEVLVPELDVIGALGLGRHGTTPTLLVACGPLRLRDRVLKRLFDVFVSSAMLVVLAPVMAAAAVAIRLESPGPMLFAQDRIGRGNRLFRVLKFRTMRADAADGRGDRSTAPGDDRITRVGRLLRKTSIDELPQLVNVLKGEMSIVGPRPHPLGCRAEDALFWTIEDRYFDRHAIKPGITGLAQVRGLRGATWKRTDLSDRLHADLEYLRDWHIGRDVAILLRTVGVLIHPNAF